MGDSKEGIIAALCYDNESAWDVFRDWIGLPKERPPYEFLKKGEQIAYIKEGYLSVSCDK